MILYPVCQAGCERVVRNGSAPRQGSRGCTCASMWSSICKNCERLAKGKSGGSAAIIVAVGRRMPKFGVDGTGSGGGGGAGPAVARVQPAKEHKRQQTAGHGKRESQQNEEFAKVVEKAKPVIMGAAAKVAKRVPLIKFPNRKAGEKQGAAAVSRASGGGGQSQAMPSLPSGTASSQPPRTKLSEAEIEAILLGGAAP